MGTYSSIYEWFNWIHINSNSMLALLGVFFSAVLRLLNKKQYWKFEKEFMDYIERTGIKFSTKEFNAYIACIFIYGSSAKEYYLYEFSKLNDSGRREYITERNRYLIYPLFNGARKRKEMQDKYQAYLAFKKYYKREALYIDEDTGEDVIRAFMTERETVILKPNMSGVGKGIEIVRTTEHDGLDETVSYIKSKKDCIIEEIVEQTGLFREMHPQSVNTIRVYACRLKNRTEIFGCHMRAGVGNSVVDNAGQGGVIISITENGTAWTSGMDEFGHIYLRHPNTNVFIPGIKMPEWNKAIQLVEEAMNVFPDIRFVGWDIAYTKKGWIIIEANDNGQFHGAQIPHHRGFRKQMLKYAQEL